MSDPLSPSDRPGPIRDKVMHTVRALTLAGFVVAVGTLLIGAAVLVQLRNDTLQQAKEASRNLALALGRDIGRNIAVYDLSLQGALEALQLPGIESVDPEIRQTALFDRAATAEFLGSILVLGPSGDIVADSTSIVPHQLNLSDRDYFAVQRDQRDTGLFLSRPYRSRLRAGDESVAISRRISGPQGQFQGVIMGAVRLEFFRQLFTHLSVGDEGAVTLLRTDGTLIARVPDIPGRVGSTIGDTRVFQRFTAAPSGQFIDTSAFDGVERLYTHVRIKDLPLILTVGVSCAHIYAGWWRKAATIGVILLLLSGCTATLCLLFRHELLRRVRAEEALMRAAESLSVLASTDPLTQLANRRAFQMELDQEWRRALRAETSLSVIMLDADLFKSYNDRYGHAEGDRVLQAIAECLNESIRRPGDLAARIGGEEFVALLPETEVAGARVIAERLRAAVLVRAIPHADAPSGVVTVSIGVAAVRPNPQTVSSALINAADLALYAAKRAGRNRVEVSDPTSQPGSAGIGGVPPASIASPAASSRSSL